MITREDFLKKQLLFVLSKDGEKIALRNENAVVLDAEGKTKYQVSCYRIFAVMIIGDIAITSGIINATNKYSFSILLLTRTYRLYSVIGRRNEGNSLLRRKQYEYDGIDIAKWIVKNKIQSQISAITKTRIQNDDHRAAIASLKTHISHIDGISNRNSLLGVEGSASRTYFSKIFDNVIWRGRRPREKRDYINASLDIGYTLLFDFVDAILQSFGFDTYVGVYHTEFYMRKSLTCDIMEPIRPIVDYTIRKALNLGQFKKEDFQIKQGQYFLNYKASIKYLTVFFNEVAKYKEEIFLFIQGYYRSFMKNADIDNYKDFQFLPRN